MPSCMQRKVVYACYVPFAAFVYLQGGDLRHALAADDDDEFRWDRRGREVAIDIARGLHFLHSADVVHRCECADASSAAFFPLCKLQGRQSRMQRVPVLLPAESDGEKRP